jgi:hypothetical protein
MIKSKGKVMIEPVRNAATAKIHTANPQAVTNVNQSAGPRTGNQNPGAKRAAFAERKTQASGLASMIEDAYAARNMPDYVNPRQEGIQPVVKPRRQVR